jgi:hypothetical protein
VVSARARRNSAPKPNFGFLNLMMDTLSFLDKGGRKRDARQIYRFAIRRDHTHSICHFGTPGTRFFDDSVKSGKKGLAGRLPPPYSPWISCKLHTRIGSRSFDATASAAARAPLSVVIQGTRCCTALRRIDFSSSKEIAPLVV